MKHTLPIFLAAWAATMAALPAANLALPEPRAAIGEAWQAGEAPALAAAFYSLDAVAALAARAIWGAGISLDPRRVVVGRDGWLYLGDEYRETLSAGRRGLGPEDVRAGEEVSRAMLAWNGWLAREGVEAFRFMIVPDKPSVYPDGLPRWAASHLPGRVEAVTAGPAPGLFVDLRDGLEAVARESASELYYRTDTHWNALGAVHGFRLFAEQVREAVPEVRWVTDGGIRIAATGVRHGGDLAEFLRIADTLTETDPVVELPLAPGIDTVVSDFATGEITRRGGNAPIDDAGEPVRVVSPQALNRRRVLWLRDSFGVALSPYMAATFSEVVQFDRHDAFAGGAQQFAQIVRAFRPDLVFITAVERNVLNPGLAGLPPSQ